MKRKIVEHFKKVDPKIHAAIDEDIRLFTIDTKEKTPSEYFEALCRSIVGQQLSGKAAQSIYERFLNVFPRKKVSPKKLSEMTEHELRAVGMSYAKARALIDHAQKVLTKDVTYKNIKEENKKNYDNVLLEKDL